MGFIKKQGTSFYLSALAVLLSLIGMIGVVVSGSISGHGYVNGETIIALSVLSVSFFAASTTAVVFLGEHHFVCVILHLLSIASASFVVAMVLNQRTVLASALFTYDKINSAGWSAFYSAVVGIAGELMAAVTMTVGAFLNKSNRAEYQN